MWWLIGIAVYLIIGFALSFIVVRPDKKATEGNLWEESPPLAFLVTVGWGVILLTVSITGIGTLARKTARYFNEK